MFDLMFNPGNVQGQYYDNVEQGMNSLGDVNWASGFTGGQDPIVDARKQPDGTYFVRRQRPGGDPHWTQSATFTVDPATGVAHQVTEWGGDQKDSSPGSTVAQGVALAALAAGGLGAAGFLGGGVGGLGGAAGAAGGDGAFLGEGIMSGVPAWDGAYVNALLPSMPGGAAGAVGASGGFGSDVGQYAAANGLGLDAPFESGFPAASYSNEGLHYGLGGLDALTSSPINAAGSSLWDTAGSWLGNANSFLKNNGSLLNFGGNLLNGYLGSRAAGKAADAQTRASQEANALLKSMYDQTRADNMPALDARNNGLSGYQNLLKDPSAIVNDPGYKFGLDQGTRAINSQAAAKGSYYSGNTLKALDKYGQDYGSTKFDQSLDRYGRLAGLGSSGAALVSNAGQNYGNNVSNNLLGMGNANASAYVGSANSWNNALSGALNSWQQQQLIDQLTRRQPGIGGGP